MGKPAYPMFCICPVWTSWPSSVSECASAETGKPAPCCRDVVTLEEMRNTLALLKLLALGDREIKQGQVQPLADTVANLRAARRKEFGAST